MTVIAVRYPWDFRSDNRVSEGMGIGYAFCCFCPRTCVALYRIPPGEHQIDLC